MWRGMLTLRNDLKKIIDYKLGDETSVNFWNDPWVHGCSLFEKFPRVKKRDVAVRKNAKFSDLWRNNWILLDPIDAETEEAWSFIRSNFKLSNDRDSINWKVVHNNRFFISNTRGIYREQHEEVAWHKMVWGKNSVPIHNFILWIIMKNKLRIKDRLKKWGILMKAFVCCACNITCFRSRFELFLGSFSYGSGSFWCAAMACFECPFLLVSVIHCLKRVERGDLHCRLQPQFSCSYSLFMCNTDTETRDHICYEFPVSRIIWSKILKIYNCPNISKTVKVALRRNLLTAIVYSIWKARNKKFFNNEALNVNVIIKRIKMAILCVCTD
ncbi:uncharacterized protein LOC126671818 [Mercurialis annua]|uniref:uncharacterized protein LOC126671818 n=1 Tax=Mercurialis annua TaxID=3986 RepID=UPI0021607946|nr:uncharacterized protein LOC126671818 [Mercurialis annua]